MDGATLVGAGLFALTLAVGLSVILLKRELNRYDQRMARLDKLEDQMAYLSSQVEIIQRVFGVKPERPPKFRLSSDDSTTEDSA